MHTGSNNTYLYIIGGNICQKVEETTPGARRREFENPTTKAKGVKFEIVYRSWEGIIRTLSFRDTDFGHQLNVEFDDAVLTIDTSSRYFSDFAKKLPSINIEEPIEIVPYDWEPEPGKRSIGMNLVQHGKKMKNYYWDELENKPCHGIPAPIGNTKTYKSDDWKVFYISVKKFFISEIEKLGMSKENKKEQEQQEEEMAVYTPQKVDVEIPIVKQEEIKVKDIPF